MQAADKTKIKDLLLGLMVSVPAFVQRVLSEALAIIAAHDFPGEWKGLLPDLVAKLGQASSAANWPLVLGLLQTCHAIFKGYRYEYKSDELFMKLQYILEHLQEPLLTLYKHLAAVLNAGGGAAGDAAVLLQCLESATEVHYSLASQDLPAYFEDHMKEWMEAFHSVFSYRNAALAGPAEDPPGPLENAWAAIVETLALYISKYEEEFQPYLATFVTVVWQLVIAATPGPRHDGLATTSVKFLTSVATSVHHTLFREGSALQDVCEKIIIRNMRLVEADEEMFEDDPTEYIRRDIEGSDADTRRRVSAELVRALCRNFEVEVSGIFTKYIEAMLAEYAAAPQANWKSKDVAVYMVTALSFRAGTARLGATQTSPLIDIPQFFEGAILQELQAAGAQSGGMLILKADALKFVATFRSQLVLASFRKIIPLLPALLQNQNRVVHTYAAHAVDRLLTTKDPNPTGSGPPVVRFGASELAAFVEPLLVALFGVFKHRGSEQNDYAMKVRPRARGRGAPVQAATAPPS